MINPIERPFTPDGASDFGSIWKRQASQVTPDARELAKHIDAVEGVDISAFFKARSEAWHNGKRENEQLLKEMHPTEDHKSRI